MNRLSGSDIKLGLGILTETLKKLDVYEVILIGGVVLRYYDRPIVTKDIDILPENRVLLQPTPNFLVKFEQACKNHGLDFRKKRSAEVYFLYIIKPDDGEIRIDLVGKLRKTPPLHTVVDELGTIIVDNINGVDIKIPTHESLFILKLLRSSEKDLPDLFFTYEKSNKNRIMHFCEKHNLMNVYLNTLERIGDYTPHREIIYRLALQLPEKTLRNALKRAGQQTYHHHENNAIAYATYHNRVKTTQELRKFISYLKNRIS
ncbi:MAG: hypothetical protein U9M95_06485 [Candidatus Altiarchaeota archaeon]|nr:hypothetical protein [Candidatus Altiarchaeota archaeon]